MRMSNIFARIDWQLIIPVFILIIFSLTTLLSISFSFFTNQLIFVFICIGIYIFFSQVEMEMMRYYGILIYIISIILLTVVLLLGIESRGAVRWIDIGGFRIQFSEILKPFLLLFFASILSNRDRSFKTLLIVFGFLLPVVFLIYRQPDLGNALIYIGVVLFTLVVFGFPLWWFLVGIAGVGIAIPFLLRILHEYQRQRIFTFLHLYNDPLGTSYNAIQAIIAVGSGQFFGKGLGQGTQSGLKFLPERHTDFLFATLSEDLGFIGGFIVILCFCFLFYRLYSIFIQSEKTFDKVFITSVFVLLLLQFFINVGMNIGLLPIVGVTLPFMSYGGSSLLSNAIILGLVSSISSTIRKKHMLEIK